MAKKPSVTTLASGFNSTEALNTNFTNIRDQFDNTLSLDGSVPNAMEADLDINNNDLLNVNSATITTLTNTTLTGDSATFNSLTVDGANINAFTAAYKLKLDNIENNATADQTASEIEALVSHDNLQDFVANEHIDWTTDQGSTNIHAGNYTDTTYSIGNGGLTEVNFTAALNNKLTNIEDNSTADQTASEILTSVKTVDGASSGLDADLLDGQHGSYYTGYADTAVSNLVDSAPSTLDTLNELAAALGDDASFSTTVTNSIATKMPLAGGTFTGNTSYGDNDKIIMGDGNDLQIYSDGDASHIDESGSGNFVVKATNIQFTGDNDESLAWFVADGAVSLYHNGSDKAQTTSSGFNVNGNITASGTVDGRDVATDGTKLDGLDQGVATTDAVTHLSLNIKNGSSQNSITSGGGYLQYNADTSSNQQYRGHIFKIRGVDWLSMADYTNSSDDKIFSRKKHVFDVGAEVTGNITVTGTVDGVDIAARDAILTSTTTTANASMPQSGGTFTGDISFEGATANAYETTLTVTDPTYDRTITLPNASGTVMVQNSSGYVTGGSPSATMILQGSNPNFKLIDTDADASKFDIYNDYQGDDTYVISVDSSDEKTNSSLLIKVDYENIASFDTTGVDVTGRLQVANGSTSSGYIDLLEDSDNGTNKIKLEAPQIITSDKTITLPDHTGTVGLHTDLVTGDLLQTTDISVTGNVASVTWGSSFITDDYDIYDLVMTGVKVDRVATSLENPRIQFTHNGGTVISSGGYYSKYILWTGQKKADSYEQTGLSSSTVNHLSLGMQNGNNSYNTEGILHAHLRFYNLRETDNSIPASMFIMSGHFTTSPTDTGTDTKTYHAQHYLRSGQLNRDWTSDVAIDGIKLSTLYGSNYRAGVMKLYGMGKK